MISQSELSSPLPRGAGRLGNVSDLFAARGPRELADLVSRSGMNREISELLYPEIEISERKAEVFEVSSPPWETSASQADPDSRVDQLIASARDHAYASARAQAESEGAARLAEERRRVDRLRVEFARDRQRFFAAAESQVVRLALAVASRILAREVKTDGMHLRSTVKAALARVQDHSATVLRVPVEEVEAWGEVFQRGSAGKVKIVGDEQMVKGECALDTTVGRVEFSVETQMKEVERGFSELLQGEEDVFGERTLLEPAGMGFPGEKTGAR